MSVAVFKKKITVVDGEFYVDGVKTNYLELECGSVYDLEVEHDELLWATWSEADPLVYDGANGAATTKELNPAELFNENHYDIEAQRNLKYLLSQCPTGTHQDVIAEVLDEMSTSPPISSRADETIDEKLLNARITDLIDSTYSSTTVFDIIAAHADTLISALETRSVGVNTGNDTTIYDDDGLLVGLAKDGIRLDNDNDYTLQYSVSNSEYRVGLKDAIGATSKLVLKTDLVQFASNNGITTGSIQVRMGMNDRRKFFVNTTQFGLENSLVVKAVEPHANPVFVHHQFDEWTRNTYPMFEDMLKLYYDGQSMKGEPQELIRNLGAYNDIDTALDETITKLLREVFNIGDMKASNRLVLKRLNDFNTAKGTPLSYSFLTNAMLGKQAKIHRYSDEVFRLSDNTWKELYVLTVSVADINAMLAADSTLQAMLGLSGSATPEDVANALQGYLVEGRNSKAFGIIESVSKREVNLEDFFLLRITMKQGVFDQDEKYDVKLPTKNLQLNMITFAKTECAVVDVQVVDGGEGYTRGDNVVVNSTTGQNFEAVVSDVGVDGSVQNVEIVDGGWFYKPSDVAEIEFDFATNAQTQDFTTTPTTRFERNAPSIISSPKAWWTFGDSGGVDFGYNGMALDFVNDRYMFNNENVDLPNILTDTHSSDILALNSSGTYDTFAANEIVRNDLGLQVVPSATNGITNSGMLNGAIGVMPDNWLGYSANGLLVDIVGVGASFGLNYVDVRFSGTNTKGSNDWPMVRFELGDIFIGTVSQGDNVTKNAYIELVGGTITHNPRFTFREFNGGVAGDWHDYPITPTTTRIRFSESTVIANAATDRLRYNQIFLTVPDTETVDFTIRIWAPQLTKTAFAVPPIITTGSPVTVPGNQSVISGLTMDTGVEFCMIADVIDPGSNYVRTIQLDNETNNERINLEYNTTNARFAVNDGGGSQGYLNLGAWETGISGAVGSVTTNYIMSQLAGGAPPPVDVTGSFPTVTQINFGGGVGVSENTYLRIKEFYMRTNFIPDATSFAEMLALATARKADY